jgi:hypothetical protein
VAFQHLRLKSKKFLRRFFQKAATFFSSTSRQHRVFLTFRTILRYGGGDEERACAMRAVARAP